MDSKPVAVFDIDGTLFRSSLFLELVRRMCAAGIFPEDFRKAYEADRLAWQDRKGEYETYLKKVVETFLRNIKGISYEETMAIAKEVIQDRKDRVYRYTRDLMKELKDEGYFLLAISHSPRFILDGFCKEAGFNKVYGLFYETGPTGNFTGTVEDYELMLNKAAILERAVKKEGLTLKRSVGVGDTESDIPMLELVDRPIAFNPNRTLFEHAKKREWKIVVERKDMIYEL
jgi:HAD superfamily hydrolase (TIGR01490 family)